MKRRTKAILAAVLSAALLAASALAFTACGEEDGFARVYEMTDWSANYTTATEVTALRGMEVGSGFYDMVIVSEENADGDTMYGVYSLRTGDYVLEPAEGSISVDSGIFTRTVRDTSGSGTSTYRCYARGVQIASMSSDDGMPNITRLARDLVRVSVGGAAYYADPYTGSVTRVDDGLTATASSADYAADDLLVSYGSGRSSVYANIYDKSTGSMIRRMYVDTAGGSASTFVLGNGNIAVQVTYLLPSGAAEYDYIDDGEPRALETYIMEIGSGNVRESDADFIIGMVDNAISDRTTIYGLYDEVYETDNVAVVREITGSGYMTAAKSVFMSNSLGIERDLSELSPDIGTNGYGVGLIAPDRIAVNDDTIVNGKGEILASDVTFAGISYFYKRSSNTCTVYSVETLSMVCRLGLSEDENIYVYSYGDSILVVSREGNDTTFSVYDGADGSSGVSVDVDRIDTTYFMMYGVFFIEDENGYAICSVDTSDTNGYRRVLTASDSIGLAFSFSSTGDLINDRLLAVCYDGTDSTYYILSGGEGR